MSINTIKMFEKTEITYTKEVKNDIPEITTRSIVPLELTESNLRAVELTNLDNMAEKKLMSVLDEYKEYVELKMSTIFGFSDWMKHTDSNIEDIVKWKNFKTSKTTLLP